MKKNYYLLIIIVVNYLCSHAQNKSVALSEFQMSNTTSPAFQLLEETITDVYTPENVKALALHVQENFGESIAIEIAPYFFINTKNKNRTYDKYIGVSKKDSLTDDLKQNIFSGIFNTATLSFGYIEKDFESIIGDNKHKTFSVGGRTTILRFFNKNQVYQNRDSIVNLLQNLTPPPNSVFKIKDKSMRDEAIKKHYLEQQKIDERLKPFQKTIKPIFKLDGAVAYSNLFKDSSIKGGTANRFGSWLTGELNWQINKKAKNSKTNNYISVLLVTRYIEDGFNAETVDNYVTNYYRDLGGKAKFEFGRFSFGYEYIKRYGTIESERSVGNISFAIDKNISITGGFGKDFEVTDNLLAIFGINWGINLGDSSASTN